MHPGKQPWLPQPHVPGGNARGQPACVHSPSQELKLHAAQGEPVSTAVIGCSLLQHLGSHVPMGVPVGEDRVVSRAASIDKEGAQGSTGLLLVSGKPGPTPPTWAFPRM
jgi:hypothetical protein